MSGHDPVAIIRLILDVLLGLGLPSVLVWFVRDRAKSRAAAQVARATIGAGISSVETAALEAHVAYVEKAFDAERQSMSRQVKDLETEVSRLRKDLRSRDELINELRGQVASLTEQMDALHKRLSKLPPASGGP